MRFIRIALVNCVLLVLPLAIGEIAIRLYSQNSAKGAIVADVLLLPRKWEHSRATNTAIIKKIGQGEPYIVSDDLLGWTLGAGRCSEDGLYCGSAEGIRSEAWGVKLTERH